MTVLPNPPYQRGMKGVVKNLIKRVLLKIYHPPLITPIEGGKVPLPLVGEGWVRGIPVPIHR
jgi:hypothetical protein